MYIVKKKIQIEASSERKFKQTLQINQNTNKKQIKHVLRL